MSPALSCYSAMGNKEGTWCAEARPCLFLAAAQTPDTEIAEILPLSPVASPF